MTGIQKKTETVPIRISQDVINSALDLWSRAGKFSAITVAGSSMEPLVQHGDHLLVLHDVNGLKPGNLVVFRQADKVVAHRIIQIYRDRGYMVLVTKGDNSLRSDPLVYYDQIIGRVVGIEHNDRVISIDNNIWNVAGWLIAIIERAWVQLVDSCKYKYRILFRHIPIHIVNRLVKFAYLCLSLPKKVIHLILLRS